MKNRIKGKREALPPETSDPEVLHLPEVLDNQEIERLPGLLWAIKVLSSMK